ncbi:EAL domain-containing protein [uncultured Mitsuokella sp.]|uniref:EAL domain-containing protein n=1 Tax=uncultured Mitsuokella sp. TaxID=453120 RepID=UPI00266EEE75|nr:EAL domain-containing protein [uncultured Mitsuokella sp.]
MNDTILDYIASHFKEALLSGCITVCYEPVLRALTGKICAFEALARWHDPEYGDIAPHDFIPVLEAHDKVHLLDYFVTKVTMQNLHTRRRQKLPIVPVILNLSRRDFLVSDPVRVLNHLTEKYRLPRIYFQVEITETAFVEDEAIITKAIGHLRQNGYSVTLDNFGEGHSSLAALQRNAIDEISLDGIFFDNFTEATRQLLTSILLMAKTLGIHTAAEGVRTEDQADFLRRIGCEKMQGPICRTMARPLEEGALAQPYRFETRLEQQIFHRAGLTNLVTETPTALFSDDGNHLHILTTNASYQKMLRLSHFDSLPEANKLLLELPQVIHVRLRALADATIRSHQMETDLFISNGRYFYLKLHNIAGTNGFYIHRAELQFLQQGQKSSTGEEYDHIVRHLMRFYHDIYLIDNQQNRIEIITASISSKRAGSHLQGIMTAFMRFARLHIHQDDQRRFLQYIHGLAQGNQIPLASTKFDLFRVKVPNGGFHWTNFSLTSFRYNEHPCQLLCLHDFVFEELPDRAKIINTVMASYGFTTLPEDQKRQLSDAALWQTLTQFSSRKLFWKDRDGRFCGASPAFLRYYGIQNINELIGKADRDLGWHLADTYMDQGEMTILQKGDPIHNGHGRCIARGRQHAISFSKYPIYQGTEIVGLLGEFRDVEEERNYHQLQRKLYLIDEETDLYNYRGMILASVEFADNLRQNKVGYVGAMFVVPEFASFAKLYGNSVRHAALQRICAIIKKTMPTATVIAHTGSGVFVLFLKGQTVGTMRTFIEQIQAELTAITEIEGLACHFSMRYALESGSKARSSDEFLQILSSRCLDYMPSFGVTGMIRDQIPFDLEKFDHTNRLIYIADPETYDLLYANPAQLLHSQQPPDCQYAGQKCYRLIAGLSAPCSTCPKDKLRRDRFHFRQLHSMRTSKDYLIWNTLISWENRSCIFSDSLDVEHMLAIYANGRLTTRDDISINDITSLAIQEEDPNVGILRMMEKLGRTLKATHIVLMEEESDGFHLSCTYEWHTDDATPLRERLQHITILENKAFYSAFHNSPILLVDNATAYQKRHPKIQAIHQTEWQRYAIGQLTIEHRSLGYIAIINPAKDHFTAITKPLHTILRVTSIMMRNRDNIKKLHTISTIDQLTGVGNRRALTDFVANRLHPGSMYAIFFIDVNGLKKMNDTFGHARGDLLIQTIAYVLADIAPKDHVFRLGGDEFLALMPCRSDEEAIIIIDRIEQSMHIHHCSAAIGYVLCLAPFSNLDAIIHEADEKMYRDKKKKHMCREDD